MQRPDRLLTKPFVLLCVASCLGAFGLNLLLVTPRYLRLELGFDSLEIGLVMGAFSLASLTTMVFVPRIADRLGRRVAAVAGMLICGLASAPFALPRSVPALIGLRVVQGMGWSAVLVGSAMYATDLAPPGRLAQALGVAGVLTLVAMAAGPSLGEVLMREASFEWLCWTAAATAVAGALVASYLPETERRTSTDRPAPFTHFGPGSRLPLAAMLLAAVGFGAVIAFLADYTALRGIPTIAPFFDAYVATAIGARLTAGGLSDRIGRHRVLVPALMAQGLALGGLALLGERWHLWVLGTVFGFAHGLYYPALQALIVERAPAEVRTRAVASSNFAFAVGITTSAFGNGVLAKHAGYPEVYAVAGLMAATASVLLAVDYFSARGSS